MATVKKCPTKDLVGPALELSLRANKTSYVRVTVLHRIYVFTVSDLLPPTQDLVRPL